MGQGDSLLSCCGEIQTGIVCDAPWRRVSFLPCLQSHQITSPYPEMLCCLLNRRYFCDAVSCLVLFLSALKALPTWHWHASIQCLVWCHLVPDASASPPCHKTSSLFANLAWFPLRVRGSDLCLSRCLSLEVGIVPLWMYRDHLFIFVMYNAFYSFLFVCMYVGYTAWSQQIPSSID